MIEPTKEEKQKLDEICAIIDKALDQANAFYDCRLVLATLLGRAGAFAAGLRQAKVMDPCIVVRYFMIGLEGAFIDGKVPKIASLDDPSAGTKQ